MTPQKISTGRLTVTQRTTKHPLLQLSYAGHIFNLSRQQLSLEVAGEFRKNPIGLNGADVEFELKNGQPWRVRRFGNAQVPTHIEAKRSHAPDRECSQRDLEVGQVLRFRFDHGILKAESDGRDDIRFYADCLVVQHWRPEAGEAVTFVRDNQSKGPVARQVTPLRDCKARRLIEHCGNSDRPALWKPVASSYLKILRKEEQLCWINARERYLAQGLDVEWWRHVHPDVLLLPSTLALLPAGVVATALGSGISQLGPLAGAVQAGWLNERKPYLAALPAEAWTSFSADVLWDSSCWELLSHRVKVSVLSKVHSRASLVELLEKFDASLMDALDPEFAAAFINRILVSSDSEVETHPATWSIFARYAPLLSSEAPNLLSISRALAASVCNHPEIERRIPEHVGDHGSLIAAVRPYARFASDDHLPLSGSTQFSNLEPDDLILAASYFAATEAGRQKCEELFEGIRTRDQWTWESLQRAIAARGKLGSPDWNNFLVCGIQPRIAEIAFGTIHSQLHLGDNLVDLNRAAISELRQWTLRGVQDSFLRNHKEVHEDWRDDRRRYDVKCNLFFRSKKNSLGLRGLLIDIKAELASINDTWLPGFVFYASSNEDCAWSFVGILNPKSVPTNSRGKRVAPFFFTMPDTHRLQQKAPLDLVSATKLSAFLRSTCSSLTARKFASKSCHPVIPLLGCTEAIDGSHLTPPQALLTQSFANAQASLSVKTRSPAPMERILWVALNHLVFDGRNAGETKETVGLALKEACDLVRSPWFPVVLAKIDNTPLLVRWITDVLTTLNNNWDSISCPKCGGSGKKLQLRPVGSSAEMSFWGSLRCQCGFAADKITLVTNCHKCGSYPLVIGLSSICPDCDGLRCHVHYDGVECGTCKRTCVRVTTKNPRQISGASEYDSPYE